MKLILAQGNPGPEYELSRHNVGFLALELLKSELDVPEFAQKTMFQALIGELSYRGEKIILAKPTTYYNETGRAGRAIADFYQIDPSDILVVHDDMALDFGTIRVRKNGSDAGNKGVRSLNSHLGSDFGRIRIGINNPLAQQIDKADFVLSRFSKNELEALKKSVLPKAVDIIKDFMSGQVEETSYKTL